MKKDSNKRQIRADGLVSALSGLGLSGKDKHNYTTYSPEIFQQAELSAWYIGSDIFSRIVDLPVEEATREGYRIFADDTELTAEFEDWASRFDLDSKIEKAMKYARVFGGAGLVNGADDSIDDPSLPFSQRKFKKLNYVVPYDRFYLTSSVEVEKNPISKNFLQPKKYLISGNAAIKNRTVHGSRVVRCTGVDVPEVSASSYGYWGDSILTRMRDAIIAYASANKSAAYLLGETGRMVIEISKLYEWLQMDSDESNMGTEALKARMAGLEYSGSVINGLILGEGEKANRAMINFSGIPEMLDRAKARLSATCNIPHTILFNESPSGLGATGGSQLTHWDQSIKRMQESKLRPILSAYADLFFLETNGKIPKYKIEFNPLQIPSASEIADIQTKRAAISRGLVQDLMITPDQGVAMLTDKNDPYSLNIEVDDSMDLAIDREKDQQEPESEDSAQ